MGSLVCRAARQTGKGGSNEVTPEVCAECEAGRVFREVGCDSVTPRIWITRTMSGPSAIIESLFCGKLRRSTTLDACMKCNLVVAPTTRELVTAARALFTEERLYSAYQDLENARFALRDGRNASAVTQSCNAVESTMRACHEKLGRPLPRDKDITGLFRSTRDLLGLDTVASTEAFPHLVNTLSGVIANLGGLRNTEGDAHGKGLKPPDVPYLVAELAINISCALSTVIVRRYREIEGGKHE